MENHILVAGQWGGWPYEHFKSWLGSQSRRFANMGVQVAQAM